MLEHLVVYPRGGICNRLRAIASAKRLCSRTGARCTIAWDWGDYSALFEDSTEWMPYCAPAHGAQNIIIPGYHHIRHRLPHEGGSKKNWRVPVTTYPRIAVTSWYVFGAAEEPVLYRRKGYEEKEVVAWFPKPHSSILEKVTVFKKSFFRPRTVGMHIRRTDNRGAILLSPEESYISYADHLVDTGHPLFLATDNEETLQVFRQRYGENLLHYPKSSALKQRWPRKLSNMQDIIDDLVDLWLLVCCEYVVGSKASAYSRVAILLNSSPKCKVVGSIAGRLRYLLYRISLFRSRLAPSRRL